MNVPQQKSHAQPGCQCGGLRDGGDAEIVNRQPVFRPATGQLGINPSHPEGAADRNVQEPDRAGDLGLVRRQITVMRTDSGEVWSQKIQTGSVNPGAGRQ